MRSSTIVMAMLVPQELKNKMQDTKGMGPSMLEEGKDTSQPVSTSNFDRDIGQ